MDPHDLILVIGVLVFGILEIGVLLAERKKTAWRRQTDRLSSEAFRREAEDGIHRARGAGPERGVHVRSSRARRGAAPQSSRASIASSS